MTEPVLVALFALVGVIGTGLLTFAGIIAGLAWRRFVAAEATNNSLWLYTRVLIDAFVHDVKRPPPEPPDYIAHLYQTGNQT